MEILEKNVRKGEKEAPDGARVNTEWQWLEKTFKVIHS